MPPQARGCGIALLRQATACQCLTIASNFLQFDLRQGGAAPLMKKQKGNPSQPTLPTYMNLGNNRFPSPPALWFVSVLVLLGLLQGGAADVVVSGRVRPENNRRKLMV